MTQFVLRAYTAWQDLINTLRQRQNGRHFEDDTFKCIFLNENVWIPITISLEFVPKGPINNIPALVQIMAWRRRGDKPLSESMMVNLPTHICVTRPRWVNYLELKSYAGIWICLWNLSDNNSRHQTLKFQSSHLVYEGHELYYHNICRCPST